MHNYFKAISLSHKTAPLEIRELVALNEDSCKELLVKIKEITDASELLILSTCNRTEIYYSSLQPSNVSDAGQVLPDGFALEYFSVCEWWAKPTFPSTNH